MPTQRIEVDDDFDHPFDIKNYNIIMHACFNCFLAWATFSSADNLCKQFGPGSEMCFFNPSEARRPKYRQRHSST